MEQEILKKIELQDIKLDEISRSVKKIQMYFLWTLIITLALIILPVIGLIIAIPKFLSAYSNMNNLINF